MHFTDADQWKTEKDQSRRLACGETSEQEKSSKRSRFLDTWRIRQTNKSRLDSFPKERVRRMETTKRNEDAVLVVVPSASRPCRGECNRSYTKVVQIRGRGSLTSDRPGITRVLVF